MHCRYIYYSVVVDVVYVLDMIYGMLSLIFMRFRLKSRLGKRKVVADLVPSPFPFYVTEKKKKMGTRTGRCLIEV